MSWGTTPRLNGILIVRSERPGANSRRAPIVRPYLSRKRFCKISNPERRPLGPLGHLNRIVSTRPLWRSVCGPPSAAQRHEGAVDPIKLTLRPNAGGDLKCREAESGEDLAKRPTYLIPPRRRGLPYASSRHIRGYE